MLIEHLSAQTGISISQLDYIAVTASKRYFTFELAKRTGGTRRIDQPSRRLKAIQRWLVVYLLDRLPVHRRATAYEPGSSPLKNARLHRATRYTLRLDFKDFFPSFTSLKVAAFLRSANNEHQLGLSKDDIIFASRIVCKDGRITIGAPSSPKLTNVMMYEFDQHLDTWCKGEGLVYSRYADDIFISAKRQNALFKAQLYVKKLAARDLRLQINERKTLHLSKRNHRSITGLVITSDGCISLGRANKRSIKTQVFLFKSGQLSQEKTATLSGLLAHSFSVDRDFYDSLVAKFGGELISTLRTSSLSLMPD